MEAHRFCGGDAVGARAAGGAQAGDQGVQVAAGLAGQQADAVDKLHKRTVMGVTGAEQIRQLDGTGGGGGGGAQSLLAGRPPRPTNCRQAAGGRRNKQRVGRSHALPEPAKLPLALGGAKPF